MSPSSNNNLHPRTAWSIDSLSLKETLHSKIIRDADKLDILYAFSNPRILELNEDDSDDEDEDEKIGDLLKKKEREEKKPVKERPIKRRQSRYLFRGRSRDEDADEDEDNYCELIDDN